MAKAHVPDNTSFATESALALALAMIERAVASDVPFSRVATDRVYGVGDITFAMMATIRHHANAASPQKA